jgi:hypothetical protein
VDYRADKPTRTDGLDQRRQAKPKRDDSMPSRAVPIAVMTVMLTATALVAPSRLGGEASSLICNSTVHP